MAVYAPKNFSIGELVPPIMANAVPNPNILFTRFDPAALWTLQALRERYGKCTVNDWQWGGGFQYSGYRPEDCPEGAAHSTHKDGRAFDCKFADVTPADVWADLQANPNAPHFAHIRRIEAFDGMTWFHFDTGNHERWQQGVKVICPSSKVAVLPDLIWRG